MTRLLDITVAFVGLVLTSPLLAVVAILIKLDSRGPVVFRQSRVGRRGRDFTVCKFRSMTVEDGPARSRFDPANTQRVTRIGRLLRRTKLDELPQLWNVLKGDMALVGPRPPLRRWVDVAPERWARILTVRPGITHPATILFRHEEQMLRASPDPERAYREEVLPRKLELYEHYLATRTFWTDVVVLSRTVKAVLLERGAPSQIGQAVSSDARS